MTPEGVGMIARLVTRWKQRPFSTSVRVLFAVVFLLVAMNRLVDEVGLLAFTARLDSLIEPATSGPLTVAEWEFAFQDTTCSVSVPVSAEAVSRAEAIPTSAVFTSRGSIRRRYVRRLVGALAQGEIVAGIVADLGSVRDRLALDDDEYLELLVHAVQAIPYGTVDADIELPAEMLAEGRGVCTEKTLLLGAMLVHEGYETVMWAFDSQHHVALGVAGDAAHFRGSRYVFIETTATRYIGQAESKYAGYAAHESSPAVIALGGERAYGAAHEVEFLLAQLRRAEREQAFGSGYAEHADRASGRWREEYARRAEQTVAATEIEQLIQSQVTDREGTFMALAYDGPVLARR